MARNGAIDVLQRCSMRLGLRLESLCPELHWRGETSLTVVIHCAQDQTQSVQASPNHAGKARRPSLLMHAVLGSWFKSPESPRSYMVEASRTCSSLSTKIAQRLQIRWRCKLCICNAILLLVHLSFPGISARR